MRNSTTPATATLHPVSRAAAREQQRHGVVSMGSLLPSHGQTSEAVHRTHTDVEVPSAHDHHSRMIPQMRLHLHYNVPSDSSCDQSIQLEVQNDHG